MKHLLIITLILLSITDISAQHRRRRTNRIQGLKYLDVHAGYRPFGLSANIGAGKVLNRTSSIVFNASYQTGQYPEESNFHRAVAYGGLGISPIKLKGFFYVTTKAYLFGGYETINNSRFRTENKATIINRPLYGTSLEVEAELFLQRYFSIIAYGSQEWAFNLALNGLYYQAGLGFRTYIK